MNEFKQCLCYIPNNHRCSAENQSHLDALVRHTSAQRVALFQRALGRLELANVESGYLEKGSVREMNIGKQTRKRDERVREREREISSIS